MNKEKSLFRAWLQQARKALKRPTLREIEFNLKKLNISDRLQDQRIHSRLKAVREKRDMKDSLKL